MGSVIVMLMVILSATTEPKFKPRCSISKVIAVMSFSYYYKANCDQKDIINPSHCRNLISLLVSMWVFLLLFLFLSDDSF